MKQKTIATRHLRTKIAAGYVLILFVIFGIVYIWLNEQHRRQELEITSQKIRCLRKDIHEVYVKMVDLSLIGETVLDWNEEDMNIYHKKRLEVDSLLSLFKSRTCRSERIDSICQLLAEKEKLLHGIMLVLYEQEEIEEKIAKQVPVIARKSTREKPQKRKRTGFLGLFGKKEEAFVPFQHTGNPFFMFLLQFKLPVTVSHQLFADLHDKICANLIQGFQGVGMHPCADVLLLQIRHGMGKACNDVCHAVLDGTDFFQQVAQFCYPAVCFLFRRIIGKPLTQGFHTVGTDLWDVRLVYVHGGSPAPLPGNLFSRPLCPQVDGVVVVDVPVLVHPADDGMEVRYAALGFLVRGIKSRSILDTRLHVLRVIHNSCFIKDW